MTGQEIRELLRQKRIYQWEVAAQMNVSEYALCRWLRGPLDSEKEQAILGAIERLERPRGRSEGQG